MLRKQGRHLAVLLLMMWILPLTVLPSRAAVQTGLEGKTLSILGDSISTYAGISNNTGYSAALSNNAVYYHWGTNGVAQGDTWWQQTVDSLGMRLLVNNSWSGSCMYMEGGGTAGAFEERCVQLHSNTGETPDMIAIYLGTNDQDYFGDDIGWFNAARVHNLITETPAGFEYAQPKTCMDAYAIALHKITQRYPDAEVYCFTLLQRPYHNAHSLITFNRELSRLADYFGVYTVDLYGCGVTAGEGGYQLQMGDYVHPNPVGMDAITGAFTSAILRNSRYVTEETALHSVSWDLDGVVAKGDTSDTVISGASFHTELLKWIDCSMEVSVSMGGKDVTEACYADGVISIENVTGDLHIRASVDTETQNAAS